MATDDQITSTTSVTKLPISRKYRIQTTGFSRLPSLLSKSTTFLSQSETTHFKRYRPQQRDIVNTSSSSSKIERQTTSQTRLPPLNTPANDHNNKEKADLQRRQIYALNHLMRELEQEQFRQVCKSNGIGNENSNEVVNNNEDPNKESITSV